MPLRSNLDFVALCNLSAESSQVNFRNWPLLERWLSFSLQVSAAVHFSVGAKSSFSEDFSLMPGITCINIHISTVPSQATLLPPKTICNDLEIYMLILSKADYEK